MPERDACDVDVHDAQGVDLRYGTWSLKKEEQHSAPL